MTRSDVARIINPRELTEVYKLINDMWSIPEEVDANYRLMEETIREATETIERQLEQHLNLPIRRNLVNYSAFYKGDNNMYGPSKYFKIKKVHFNPPATVVLWEDGTKTVVKAQEGDDYDLEKGLAMAISKKALGNKGNFNEVFKKWLPEETSDDLGQYVEDVPNNFGPLADTPKVVLWKKEDDSDGN